ncbi:MAG: nicotinate-nucleotide adenylyltransferase [Acidobacteria bacterium]|nr:nicotinate-nucleotide adenylyltransferase [Acidobacteriota bacterium]
MRIGLYGGTFDPVHNAHLAVARAAIDGFSLDKLLVIPNRLPPHKHSGTAASYEDRLTMVGLACETEPKFEACDIENREGKSYTIQTLERLRIQYGEAVQFFFLIGADAFAEVLTWFRVREVFEMTEFIVAARPGFEYESPEGARVHRLDTVAYPESSSGIRAQIAAGQKPAGLPASVERYIMMQGLYRAEKANRA